MCLVMKSLKAFAATLIVCGLSSVAGIQLTRQTNSRAYIPADNGILYLVILNRNYTSLPTFKPSDVSFHLYTRSNPNSAGKMLVGAMNGAAYVPTKPTKFIVHGWFGNAAHPWVIDMKNRYLSVGDYNVIAVDWGPAATNLYHVAKENVKPTGQFLGIFMRFLISKGARPDNMHCAGHSFGAHVCGHAGEEVAGKLGRITGMDPALPLLNHNDISDRLDKSDALFVDVIHTNGGAIGFMRPIGHADFYPNGGGRLQPGCGVDSTSYCSHVRVRELFAESIISSGFRSVLCDSWYRFEARLCNSNEAVPMGELTPTSARGNYYLKTNSWAPFAQG